MYVTCWNWNILSASVLLWSFDLAVWLMETRPVRERLRRGFVWLRTSWRAVTCAGGTPSDDNSSFRFGVISYTLLPSRTKRNKHMQRSQHERCRVNLTKKSSYLWPSQRYYKINQQLGIGLDCHYVHWTCRPIWIHHKDGNILEVRMDNHVGKTYCKEYSLRSSQRSVLKSLSMWVKLSLHNVTIRRISANTHIDKITRADSLWRHVGLDIVMASKEDIPCDRRVLDGSWSFCPTQLFFATGGLRVPRFQYSSTYWTKVLRLVPINFPLAHLFL